MTKFILHGGRTTIKSPSNVKFFSEIIKDLSDGAQVLIVYFAREKEEYEKLFKQDKEHFLSNDNTKALELKVASRDNFIKQVKDADAIYIRGGDTSRLLNILKQYPNFAEEIKEKVIAGSSAGVYALSKYYIGSKGNLGNGLGILPIKTFAHYTDKHKGKLAELENYAEKLKIYTLAEKKFIVLYF